MRRNTHSLEDAKAQFATNNRSISNSQAVAGYRRTHSGDASGNMPSLPEEKRRSTKRGVKPPTTKRRPSTTSTSTSTTSDNKEKGSISTKELSGFLEQCNARRRSSMTHGKAGSRTGGDRSVVSMPASSSSAKKGQPKLTTSSPTPSNKLSSRVLHKNRRQPSQRSLQSTRSDPSSVTVQKSKKGQLIEQLGEKNARSLQKSKRQPSQRSLLSSSSDPSSVVDAGHKDKRGQPVNEKVAAEQKTMRSSSSRNLVRGRKKDNSHEKRASKTTQSASATAAAIAAKDRARSVSNEAKHRKREEETKARSLSRTRHTSNSTQQKAPASLLTMESKPETKRRSAAESTSRKDARPKGFQRLFSIRDIPSIETEFEPTTNSSSGSSSSSLSSSSTSMTSREDSEPSKLHPVASPMKTKDIKKATAHGSVNKPVAKDPHPPIHEERSSGNGMEVDRKTKSKSPSGTRRRYSTASTAIPSENVSHKKQDDTSRPIRRHSSNGMSSSAHEKQRDHAHQESHTATNLKTQAEIGSTKLERRTSRGGTKERASKDLQSKTAKEEVNEQLKSAREEVHTIGAVVEEDVFTHYTWSTAGGALTRHELDEDTRRERQQLKESIRQSVLYAAFDAIDGATG